MELHDVEEPVDVNRSDNRDAADNSEQNADAGWSTATGKSRKRHTEHRNSDNSDSEHDSPSTKMKRNNEHRNSESAESEHESISIKTKRRSCLKAVCAVNNPLHHAVENTGKLSQANCAENGSDEDGEEPTSAQPWNYAVGLPNIREEVSTDNSASSFDSQLSSPSTIVTADSKMDTNVHASATSNNDAGPNSDTMTKTAENNRHEATALLERITVLQRQLFVMCERKEIVSELYEPEKCEFDVDAFETHFQSIFDDALKRISINVAPQFAKLADLSPADRAKALIDLRELKSRLIGNILRIRNGTFWRFSDDRLGSINGAYSDLSDINELRATQINSFSRISKATIGMHYVRVLKVVQERMRMLRESLDSHVVLRTAVSNMSVVESRRKMNTAARNIRMLTRSSSRKPSVRRSRAQRDRSSSQTQNIAAPTIHHTNGPQNDSRRDAKNSRQGHNANIAHYIAHVRAENPDATSKHNSSAHDSTHNGGARHAYSRRSVVEKDAHNDYKNAANLHTWTNALCRNVSNPNIGSSKIAAPAMQTKNSAEHDPNRCAKNRTQNNARDAAQISTPDDAQRTGIRTARSVLTRPNATIDLPNSPKSRQTRTTTTYANAADNSALASNSNTVSNNVTARVDAHYQVYRDADYDHRQGTDCAMQTDSDDAAHSAAKNRNNNSTNARGMPAKGTYLKARNNSAILNDNAVPNNNMSNSAHRGVVSLRAMADTAMERKGKNNRYRDAQMGVINNHNLRNTSENSAHTLPTYNYYDTHYGPFRNQPVGEHILPFRGPYYGGAQYPFYIPPPSANNARYTFQGERRGNGILGPFPEGLFFETQLACAETESRKWHGDGRYRNPYYGRRSRPWP
jgi:hypothetical protein